MTEKKKPLSQDFEDVSKERNGKWQHLVEHCLDAYEDSKESQYRKNTIEEIKKSRKAYAQIEEKTSDPWPGASNLILPLTTISVDNLEPRFVAGMIGREPYVKFVLEGDSEPDDDTKTVESWWNEELKNGVKIDKFTREQTHDLMLDGTVYPMPQYDIEETDIKDFQFDQEGNPILDQNKMPVVEEKTVTTFEGGKVDLIPFTDIYIADDVDDWEKATVIRKVYEEYADLKRYTEESKIGYCNIGPWLLNEEQSKKLSESQQTPDQQISQVEGTGKETIECIECSLTYIYQDEEEEKKDIKNWKQQRIVVQIALDKKIIIRLVRLKDLNYRNEHLIKRVRLFPEKKKSYGTSIYGKMKAIQKGASKTFNTVINSATVMMIPWFFYTESAGLSGDITLYPGRGVKVESNPNESVMFPKFNFNPNQFIDFVHLWTLFWERLISIGDLQIGRAKETGKHTAHEIMSVIQEGNIKHNYQSDSTKEEYLSVIRTLYDLYYQYMPLDKTFKYEDQDRRIPRQTMGRNRKFRLTGSTELNNKLIEQKQNIDLYNFTMEDQKGVFSPIPIAEDLLKSFGKDNPKEYINPFLAWITAIIQKMPQLEQVIKEAVDQTLQAAQELEQGANANIQGSIQ